MIYKKDDNKPEERH